MEKAICKYDNGLEVETTMEDCKYLNKPLRDVLNIFFNEIGLPDQYEKMISQTPEHILNDLVYTVNLDKEQLVFKTMHGFTSRIIF